uniref:Uncharacterized protein n=1 Tax=Felis catus TaxID=9685 RepID=A0ABI7YJ94_FELCA
MPSSNLNTHPRTIPCPRGHGCSFGILIIFSHCLFFFFGVNDFRSYSLYFRLLHILCLRLSLLLPNSCSLSLSLSHK